MSKRSKSLIKVALVGLALVALMFGAFQVLIEDESPESNTANATASESTTDDTAKPTLQPGADPESKTQMTASTGEAGALPVTEPGAAKASAPLAAARATWIPAEGSFTGRVLNAGGEGVAEAKVTLLSIDEKRMKGFPEGMRAMWLAQMKKQGNMAQILSMLKAVETKKTDPEGRFALPAPDGKVEHWLRIQHKGYCGVFSDDFKAAPATLSVTLLKAAKVVVTITAPDASPLKLPQVTIDMDAETTPRIQASPLAFQIDTAPTKSVMNVASAVAASVAKEAVKKAKKTKTTKTAKKSKTITKTEAKEAVTLTVGKAKALGEPVPPVESKTFVKTLEQVPSGRHTVYASADGFKTTSAPAVVTEGGDVAVSITLEEGLSLHGTVVDDRGEPLAKAHVSGWKQGAWSGKQKHMRQLSARTDAEGKFTIKGLEKSVYRFSASLASYQQTNWKTTATPGGSPLKLVLNRTYTIRGKVVIEPSGEPAVGIGVTANSKSRQWYGRGSFTTQEDGSFELAGRLPGRYTLTAKDDKHTTLDPVQVTVKDGDVEGVVLKVQAGAKAEVLVVSQTGGPLKGAQVAVLTGAEARFSRAMFMGGGKKQTVTGDDGKVQLEGLGPGEYKLVVKLEDYAQGEATLRVDEGKAPDQVRVELVPGAKLSCTILNADGTPFAKKMVLVMAKDATLMSPAAFQNQVATDEQGKFTKGGMSAGDYRLQSMDMGGAGGGALRPLGEVRLQAGQTTEVELRVKAATASVSGRVLKGTKPQPGVQVMIYQEGDLLAGFAQTTTNAEGVFKAEKLGAGKYVVTASGAAKTTVELKETSAVDVTLEIQAGVVAGRIVGPDGAPAANARIYLKRTDGGGTIEETFRSSEQSDGLGFFKIDKVRPGTYQLIASAPGVGSSKGKPLTLGADEAKTGLNVILTAGGTLSLSITNDDSKPAVGAGVGFYHLGLKVFSQQMDGWGAGESTTDRHGVVKLENLVPGSYVVFVSSAGNKQALLENVVVSEGGVVSKSAVLAKPGTLQITGPPNTNVTVKLVSSGAPMGGSGLPWAELFGLSKTDASGVLKVSNLPSVEVEVKGTTTDGKPAGTWRGTIVGGETTQAALN